MFDSRVQPMAAGGSSSARGATAVRPRTAEEMRQVLSARIRKAAEEAARPLTGRRQAREEARRPDFRSEPLAAEAPGAAAGAGAGGADRAPGPPPAGWAEFVPAPPPLSRSISPISARRSRSVTPIDGCSRASTAAASARPDTGGGGLSRRSSGGRPPSSAGRPDSGGFGRIGSARSGGRVAGAWAADFRVLPLQLSAPAAADGSGAPPAPPPEEGAWRGGAPPPPLGIRPGTGGSVVAGDECQNSARSAFGATSSSAVISPTSAATTGVPSPSAAAAASGKSVTKALDPVVSRPWAKLLAGRKNLKKADVDGLCKAFRKLREASGRTLRDQLLTEEELSAVLGATGASAEGVEAVWKVLAQPGDGDDGGRPRRCDFRLCLLSVAGLTRAKAADRMRFAAILLDEDGTGRLSQDQLALILHANALLRSEVPLRRDVFQARALALMRSAALDRGKEPTAAGLSHEEFFQLVTDAPHLIFEEQGAGPAAGARTPTAATPRQAAAAGAAPATPPEPGLDSQRSIPPPAVPHPDLSRPSTGGSGSAVARPRGPPSFHAGLDSELPSRPPAVPHPDLLRPSTGGSGPLQSFPAGLDSELPPPPAVPHPDLALPPSNAPLSLPQWQPPPFCPIPPPSTSPRSSQVSRPSLPEMPELPGAPEADTAGTDLRAAAGGLPEANGASAAGAAGLGLRATAAAAPAALQAPEGGGAAAPAAPEVPPPAVPSPPASSAPTARSTQTVAPVPPAPPLPLSAGYEVASLAASPGRGAAPLPSAPDVEAQGFWLAPPAPMLPPPPEPEEAEEAAPAPAPAAPPKAPRRPPIDFAALKLDLSRVRRACDDEPSGRIMNVDDSDSDSVWTPGSSLGTCQTPATDNGSDDEEGGRVVFQRPSGRVQEEAPVEEDDDEAEEFVVRSSSQKPPDDPDMSGWTYGQYMLYRKQQALLEVFACAPWPYARKRLLVLACILLQLGFLVLFICGFGAAVGVASPAVDPEEHTDPAREAIGALAALLMIGAVATICYSCAFYEGPAARGAGGAGSGSGRPPPRHGDSKGSSQEWEPPPKPPPMARDYKELLRAMKDAS